MATSGSHEQFDRHDRIEVGSERSFGIVFAVVFAIIGLWPLLRGGDVRWWSLGIAAVFLGLGLLAPAVLRPLNLIWFKLGMLLSKVMTPLVMGFLFFVVVTPTALIMRLRRKDLLRCRIDKGAASYWIRREPPGPAPETMTKQF